MANPTGPVSRIMKTRHGWVQDYTAQAAVTHDQIILAADITKSRTTFGSYLSRHNG